MNTATFELHALYEDAGGLADRVAGGLICRGSTVPEDRPREYIVDGDER